MIHIYHGDGKGKTTAAIGLSVRAAGSGYKVFFTQFMKGGKTGELKTLSKIDGISISRCSKDYPFFRNMTEEEKAEQTVEHNLLLGSLIEICKDKKQGEKYLIILDELVYPINYGLVDKDLVYKLLEFSGEDYEMVVTGRNPKKWLLDMADYITEMRCERHPYEKGIVAREGIEY